jgi:DNA-binding beta-propeller fold protein YncE
LGPADGTEEGQMGKARLWGLAGGLVLLLAGPVVTPALASDNSLHTFASAFAGEGICKMAQPAGMAVDEATGEVFVYDRGRNMVFGFSASGTCLNHFKVSAATKGEAENEGIAFDNSNGASGGDLYVVAPDEFAIHKYRITGEAVETRGAPIQAEPGLLEPFRGLAVDAAGNLYDYQGEEVIDLGGAEPNVLESRITVAGATACGPRPGFAVSPDGEAFYIGWQRVTENEECEETVTTIRKIEASTGSPAPVEGGIEEGRIDNAEATGVASDPASGETYVDEKAQVAAFTATASFVQRFGEEKLSKSMGVAVDGATGVVFATSNPGEVEEFASASEPPPAPLVSAAGQLADNRGWELVTPPDKRGSSVFGITYPQGIVQAAENGDAITFPSSGPIVPEPPGVRGPEATFNVARRGASSWSTQDVVTPRTPPPIGFSIATGHEYRAFSGDLSTALIEPDVGERLPNEQPLAPEATETTLYMRDMTQPSTNCAPVPSRCYRALVSPQDNLGGAHFGGELHALYETNNGGFAAFESGVPLLASVPGYAAATGLYEWNAKTGKLALIDELPAKEPLEINEPTLGQSRGGGAFSGDIYANAISEDGRRVFWSQGVSEERALYMRDTELGLTIRLDKAQGIKKPELNGAIYWGASTTGSRAFFTDTRRLVPTATTESEAHPAEYGDLYVCEIKIEAGVPVCHLSDLTTSVRGANEQAGVQGVIGTSEDGSYVYFVANGALARQTGGGDCEATPPSGSCTLYMEHYNGEVGKEGWEAPRPIARLSATEADDWHGPQGPADLTARVSPGGTYLAFMSAQPLTGYDNEDAGHPGVHDLEVYLYDAITNKLVCASCNPTGAKPAGVFDPPNLEANAEGQGLLTDPVGAWGGDWLAGNIPGWTNNGQGLALYQSRYLSTTGRLFFNSPDQLVPADRNHKEDVYEYEPDGEGSCRSESGCVSLMSSGAEGAERESAFIDASKNGSDVFFETSQSLSMIDRDTTMDIYDARVCSGEDPCETPSVAEHAQCDSEGSCRSAAASVPAAPAITPSQTSSGAGNHGTLINEVPAPPRPLTPKQVEQRELKSCRARYKKAHKRHACESKARRRYAAAVKARARRAAHRGAGR